MHKCLTTSLFALACLALSGCILKFDVNEMGRKASLDESRWNAERIWKHHQGDPKLFVPASYRGPVGAQAGGFVEDERDGKRFFIPKGGTDDYPESVLRNDAYKSSGKRPKAAIHRE